MEQSADNPLESAEVPVVPMKEVRHRKKQFYKNIRGLMEFYFSDANLSKNRFMGKIIREDPNVDLNLFLTFNKIRALTRDTEDIVKALRKSQMLAITEDGTKVYRTSPMRENDQVDECTIYVEHLPPDAEHEWLRSIFLPYGSVPYISIPKYPTSKLNKGFAFVEFDTPESANRALEAFGAMGCLMTTQIHPDQLCSIVSSDEFQMKTTETEEINREKESEDIFPEEKQADAVAVVDKETLEEDGNCVPYKKRRKMLISDSALNEEVGGESGSVAADVSKMEINEDKEKLPKKRKISCEGAEIKSKKRKGKEALESAEDEIKASEDVESRLVEIGGEKDVDGEEKRSKKARRVGDDIATVVSADKKSKQDLESTGDEVKPDEVVEGEAETGKENGVEEKRKKKSRSHKKKTKKEDRDDPKMSLRILPKCEWKRLRSKYLDLQKSKMMNLKQHLARSRWGNNYSQEPREYYHYASQRNEEPDKEQPVEEKPAVKPTKQFSFVPGVILHVHLEEPVSDVQAFKASARTHGNVLYIDLLEGSTEAHIRCTTAEVASRLATEGPWRSEVLAGEEETQYWEKITRDRDQKLSKAGTVRVKKEKRGREKLLAKAEKALGKHIRFDEHE